LAVKVDSEGSGAVKEGRSKPKKLAPIDELASYRLAHKKYDALYDLWAKSVLRIDHDTTGALSLATAIIEDVSKFVLQQFGASIVKAPSIQVLFNDALRLLELSPAVQAETALKSISQSCVNVVQNVAYLRNKFGDAHGHGAPSGGFGKRHAELALNLAGSLACFIVASLEATLASKKYITSDGRVILKFPFAAVWRMVDHARNSPKSLPNYAEKRPRPALWLVGDGGIYLMSNGSPAMGTDGKILRDTKRAQRRFVVHAEGCNPDVNEFDNWWPVHNKIADGDDFSFTIALKALDETLPLCREHLVIVIGRNQYSIMPDTTYMEEDLVTVSVAP
jgi:hypothetical protein